MHIPRRPTTLICATLLLAAAAWGLAPSRAQAPAAPATKFEFQVVESFDAKYLGDNPGHVGRSGGLIDRPDIALGDPVFDGDRRVGKISWLTWDRAKHSLEVEFDPEPFEMDANNRPVGPNRIAVGDEVWVPLRRAKPAR